VAVELSVCIPHLRHVPHRWRRIMARVVIVEVAVIGNSSSSSSSSSSFRLSCSGGSTISLCLPPFRYVPHRWRRIIGQIVRVEEAVLGSSR